MEARKFCKNYDFYGNCGEVMVYVFCGNTCQGCLIGRKNR